MSARGRPFRFLGLVCVAWVGARVALLWPEAGSLPEAIDTLVPLAREPAAEARPEMTGVAPALPPKAPGQSRARQRPARIAGGTRPFLFAPQPLPNPPADPQSTPGPFGPPPQTAIFPTRPNAVSDRWSASGWFVARAGRGTGTAPGGQLGGGQTGMRVAYLLAPRRRIAAYGRIAAPLAGRGGEAAIGIEWQPWQAPVRFAVEQRIGLDGAPGGPGMGVTAGLYREIKGLRIDGYGQAGVIARRRVEPYADGAIRVTHPVTPRFSLGAGAWGGAQRDARRLDIGPSAALALGRIRLSLDWRQRVAGGAAPGSGLALTLGGDF